MRQPSSPVAPPSSEGVSDRPLLNEPQRRHFEVLLSMLEDALTKIEALAVPAGDGAGTLTVYATDLPPDAVRAVPLTIAAVRTHIRALAADLGLQPRHASRRQAARALLVSEIVRLEDSTADKLRGYGAVHPDAETHLDPTLHAMRAELTALLRLVNEA